MTVRGNFRIPYFTPWAEVAVKDARSFTLRGYIYRQSDATCSPCGDDAYLPLPPDQARFGFTVIGPVKRAVPPVAGPAAATVRIAPNPFRATARITAPAPGRVEIVDVAGRRVRSATLTPGAAAFEWDGRDGRGRAVRPGLYFVRYE